MMTPTPPQSGDEAAQRTPVGLLCGRREAAARTGERTSGGHHSDAVRTPTRCREAAGVGNHSRWDAEHKSKQGNDHEHND